MILRNCTQVHTDEDILSDQKNCKKKSKKALSLSSHIYEVNKMRNNLKIYNSFMQHEIFVFDKQLIFVENLY